MSKRTPPAGKPYASLKSSAGGTEGRKQPGRDERPGQAAPRHLLSRGAVRETIEELVIIFVLVFVGRTFEAEAFVIPTGSMGPTLMGRHKDLVCPKCGYRYQASASDEIDPNTGAFRGTGHEVEGCTCPVCRYSAYLGPDNPQHQGYPSYKGDRILVGKFAYDLHDPQRWDVAVFRYPGEAKMNYIKRVVGLPGETVRISHGDIFIKPEDQPDFFIARKPPEKILAVGQIVYDNDHVLPEVIAQGWPVRWFSTHPEALGAWQTSEGYRALATDGTAPGEAWIRYRHVVPSYRQWHYLARGQGPGPETPKAQLITDFCAYNTSRDANTIATIPAPDVDSLGLHWVGDLAVECTLEVRSTAGEAILQLIKGGRCFNCRIDLATGRAGLAIDGLDSFHPTAATAVHGPGSYRVMLSNFDEELLLWINGKVAQFDAPTAYPHLGNTRPQQADLAPVGIGSRGAALAVRHLRVFRDLYYIAERRQLRGGSISDFAGAGSQFPYLTGDTIGQFFSDPSGWGVFDHPAEVSFPLKANQFLVLGDNSPRSKDSRLWEQEGFEFYVRRELLIGKALFIYWPHSWNGITIGNWEVPFPFVPNISRMKFVR